MVCVMESMSSPCGLHSTSQSVVSKQLTSVFTFFLSFILLLLSSYLPLFVPQVFVCLWKGCKVYNTPSTSQSWLQRHMLTHSGDKPFKVNTRCNVQLFAI